MTEGAVSVQTKEREGEETEVAGRGRSIVVEKLTECRGRGREEREGTKEEDSPQNGEKVTAVSLHHGSSQRAQGLP